MAAELGQQTVDFSTLVGRAAEESFLSLKELVEKSKSTDQSDTEKKINLLKYLSRTQQRMLKLNVLAKWCQQVPLIQYCQQLTSTLSSHATCFTQAADSLFFMHEGLQQARAPAYDVPSAIQVLLTGNYRRLPKCIEDVGAQGVLNHNEQKPVLKKLDTLVRSKLLEISIPKEFSGVKVSDGAVLLRVDGEFKVLVTLGYRGHLSLWRILHLELLVGEKSGPIKLEESRRHVLGDDLERRMAAAENPFATLYSVLNELCVALTMDTVTRQVQGLRRGRWKDAIRFEFVMDGNSSLAGSSSSQLNQDGEVDSASLRTPGLKIMYWLDFGKGSGASDPASCPSIKIEPGPDLQIKCLHSTFVLDPLTGKEAEFSLDQSCIDVEKLLLRAIFCNRYTRLLEIQKELSKNSQICRSVGDVKLQPLVGELDVNYKKKDGKVSAMEYEGQEVLCVRAYGSSFFALGINIRNGRFLLQSSQNILPPSSLSECEEALNQGSMTAAEVFIRLRTNSILNLFSSTGRFLGLKVYEDNSAAVKIPKNVATDSTMLLLGFPDCGTSYFLLMQLDKEFKPQFKLLETRSNLSGKAPSGDNHVTCIKKIDMDEMQLPEDELNFGLLDSGKLQSFLPNAGGLNQSTEHGLLSDVSLEGSGLATVGTTSSFSSVVDEVFDLEKGTSLPPFSVQNFSSSYNASASQYGSNPPNFQSMKTGSPSPKWEGGMQVSQVNKVSGGGRLYPPSNMSGSVRSVTSLSAGSGRPASAKRISTSKSEQDLASLRSPHSAEVGPYPSMDEDQLRFLTDSSKDTLSGNRSYRMLSPPRTTGTRSPAPSGKLSGPRTAPNGSAPGSVKALSSSPWVTTPKCKMSAPAADSAIPLCASQEIVLKGNRISRKRTVTDMLGLIPSLQVLEANTGFHKRRRISDISCTWTQQSSSHLLVSTEAVRTSGFSYGYLLSEANKGNVPSSIYVSALLHVVRHCSLSIKHARLTSQMEALDIPYVEEVGLRNASSNVWFRLPFTRGDSWQYICLRLGRPGTMYWDVKINDQHFRDLWELQKGSGSTPWGSGVRIANTSDVDSHIRYDAEGVVLSYQSVEADSVKKLVADIQRLSNARMFALGMRKLLGVKADDKQEDSTNADSKSPVGSKGVETSDKFSEQMRRVFRIEAVGLMSLWFSFGSGSGSGVLARFVVEWESGKEGCTMHVSPDQLWPHTKFLEDFINGGEVVSLLDCIRLTAGPLHSLAAATRPARATPVTAGPGVAAALSSMSKQGLLSSNVSSNINQSTATPAGNPMLSSGTAPPPGIQNLQGAAMLAAAGRGGPGIVPSSLLPIDVSVVLRGPYWIRIVYRKNFAVDMRCFAGDQVWLQPATPPKGGPSVGGSLPCPQFRPFIMEHVAQELNGIEPSFTGGPQNVVPANSNAPNMGSGQQLSMANGNRVNLSAAAAAISRSGPQVSSLNRVGPAHPGSPNLGAVGPALPIRRSPGAGVPPHVRGELNTAIIGLGDDGGYGGGWVPLVALKKVLRGILKYLGVLWLFAQLPDLLKEILGSILKDNEGALLNLDQEQPALRFFVGGYVFAVSVHRVQLLLQVLSVKRFHQQQQQQQQQQQNSSAAQDELTQAEIGEICDYFSRRVASEPYDASRVASFITLLTLPISVLREFLKLIAWKKGLVQAQGGEIAPAQKPRIELCLENHAGLTDNAENPSLSKSNIHYDRPRSSVDFALTVVLDPAHIPHINAAGGAAWLPYCVSVRLRYSFMENASVSFLRMEGSHGGRACWPSNEEWQKCKQRVARTVEGFSSGGDITQGRLRGVADNVQRTLHLCLQGLRDGGGATASSGAT
ncbi:mediator of RNA polymerase II transcription subunit 14 isoform X1 [Punica granatum]|uniref:Mediator of RNA polymerase II transcription subunit 14 n=1 Tax=Punica granatum TaxID=22663 RepID=A0A6P8CCZ4_PUNGR|nr:mediator of RNA polymerase II transcription subunit 14 isoform X1 [Punica granatum]